MNSIICKIVQNTPLIKINLRPVKIMRSGNKPKAVLMMKKKACVVLFLLKKLKFYRFCFPRKDLVSGKTSCLSKIMKKN